MNLSAVEPVDVVMVGSFGVWTRGTLQSRALPLARSLVSSFGLRVTIVTTPWDDPQQAGVVESVDDVQIINTRNISQARSLLAVAEQVRIIHTLSPRIVQVMKPKAFAGLTCNLLKVAVPGSSIVVDHDDWEGDGGWNDRAGYDVAARRLFDFQERRLLARADHVTAASTLLEERARRLRYSADRVTFLPNGLESNWMAKLGAARSSHEQANPPALVLYSRFAEFSTDWLSDALTELDSMLADTVDLHIIGSDEAGHYFPPGLRNIRSHWHGYVPRERVPALLATGNIALYPYEDNLINRSKQSVKLLELMASGCAIVASDVGDVARIGGETVIAVSPGDAQAFATAVHELTKAPRRAATLGQLARDRVRVFSIDRLADRLHGVYRECGLG